MGAVDSLTQIGPLARFVGDLFPLLQIIAGPDWHDPAIVPMPLKDPGDVDLGKLRIALHTDNGVMASTPETARVVENAGAALADAGTLVETELPEALRRSYDLSSKLSSADGRASAQRLLQRAGTTEVHPWLSKRIAAAEPIDVAEYTELLEEVDRYRSEMVAFMEGYDAIVCPTCAYPAQPHGATIDDEMRRGLSYTSAYNLTGWPGVVVRGGTSPEGLPIGVQVVARPWREDVALSLARRLETDLGGWQPSEL
jgi:amidase